MSRKRAPFIAAVLAAMVVALPGSAGADHADCTRVPPVPPGSPPPPSVTLTADRTTVPLDPGDTGTVRFRLKGPATPTPVDIFFLVDTTGSMGGALCAIQAGLTDMAVGLREQGIEARFGVAEYRDYPEEGWGAPDDFAYRRVQDLQPLSRAFLERVNAMRAGGGGDGPESALTGLYQAATGEGQRRPIGSIEPGRQASFRDDALKMIVHVTDASFHDEPGHPSPPRAKVIAALRARNILQIGITAGGGSADLTDLARATRALAADEVDCDDDGDADLDRGDPLVCPLYGEGTLILTESRAPHMAPAIVSIVSAVEDVTRVRHRILSGADAVAAVTPARSRPVDLKEPTDLSYDVSLTCPDPSEPRAVTVGSEVRGTVIATATIQVQCEPVALAIPVLPRSGPAASGGEPAPVNQPANQVQASTQSGANPAGAMAAAPQPEVNIATEEADGRPLYLAAISMAAAAALGLRRRERFAVVPQHGGD